LQGLGSSHLVRAGSMTHVSMTYPSNKPDFTLSGINGYSEHAEHDCTLSCPNGFPEHAENRNPDSVSAIIKAGTHDVREQPRSLRKPVTPLANPRTAETTVNEALAQFSVSTEIQDAYQCTPLQEGLMALSMKQPGKFMPQIVCRMPSDLDVERFKAAWQETVNSNTPLRTTIFQTSTSGLAQIVLESHQINWQSSDCLQDYLKKDLKQAVHVGSVPFRYALLDDSSSGRKYFVWTYHHALADGWSTRLLFNQVTQRYRGVNVNPLVPFGQFIAYIAQLDRQKVDDFWRRQLSGTNTDHFPALPSATYSPAPNCSLTRHIQIPNGLKALATISTIIQAAWALLVRRYTSSNDVVSGVVLAGRNVPFSNIANVNGPTLTTVPLRVCIDPEQSVSAYLTTIRNLKSVIKPYQHAGLQNIRKLDMDCAAACSFRHILVIQPMVEKDTHSLFWDRDRLSDHVTRLNTYSLMLECAMTSEGFTALANFDTAAVSEEQMKQMLAELEFAIMQFDSNIETPVGSIKTHITGASHALQTYVADSEAVDLSFPDLLAQRASERGNSVAICSWDGELSYAELDHLSQQLACRLRDSNIGSESMVSLLFEKSLSAIVAMMAVMKAGGAFVPLDPSHPKERLKSIVQEVGSGLLLCSEKCVDLFPDTFSEVIIVGLSSLSAFPSTHSILPEVQSNSSLYVIFTSGSTGKPKGCVVEHSACCSSMVQLVKSYYMDQNSRILQFSSYGFDGCILEIFGTLLAGGCICVPSEESRLNGITEFICDKKVNFAFLTPSFSRMINPERVPTLKTLIVGGEKVTREDIDRWFGKLRLFQAYGPTECCVMCVVNEVLDQSSMPNEMGRGVIGNFVILNETEKIASAGTAGELCIGGPNLARGYLNDGVKTAAAFRNDLPRALGLDSIATRLYKTGDLVKMRSDGMIEYLGRKDKQVKLRGQRVELGDVEHHLRQCLGNMEDLAVDVIAPANDGQSPILAAFLCLDRDQSTGRASVEEDFIAKDPLTPEISTRVWDRLSSSLPHYMVPTLLIPLEAIPLSASGKIDRRKLQSAAQIMTMEKLIAYSIDKREKSVPVTENEQILCRLWARILNLPADIIGYKDSFIRLGGDSISAMKLVAACREEGLVLSVAGIFRSPRLRDLAMMVTQAEAPLETDGMPVSHFALVGGADRAACFYPEITSQCDISVEEIEDLYPCTPFQEGIMVLSLRRPGAYVVQHNFELSPDLSLDLETFCLAWDTVAKANPILRTRIIQSETAGLMQVVVKEPIHWVFNGDLDEYSRKCKELSMGFGTLLARYAIVPTTRGRSDKHHFVWTTHHAIYDGWSLNLILKQVDQQYQSLKSRHTREPSRDPSKLPSNFNNFIKALQGIDPQESDTFWDEQFNDGEPKTFPRPLSKALPSPTAVLESTMQYVREGRPDATMSNIIRAAWAVTISKYANSNDVVFGATLSGRSGSIAEADSIVGPTTTTVPVRIILDPFISVADFLQGLQNQALNMMRFEHRGLANIGRINSKTMAACDLGNLLVIQPKPDADMDGNIMHRRHHESVHVGIFDTYALTMECLLKEKGLTVKAIYDPQIIDETLMNRVCSQFRHILGQLCICGDQDLVHDIQTINPEDYNTLWQWNAELPDTVDSCIHSLIEQKTLEDPDAQAVCAWDGELSYGDLDLQSSRVAHHLRGIGVGPEVQYPVLFNKSKWFVVAILGILKAGGIFAPLEPSHPPARLASIVDQLKADILVCSAVHSDMCSTTFPGCRIFVLDDSNFAGLAENDVAPYVKISPRNAAYVVFTSGTTGIPKGIVIEHGQYCSSAEEHSKALYFDRKSRHLQFASHSFDTCVEDILTTLLTGGCICIPSEEERSNDIVGAIKRLNVTKADLTPSFLNNIDPREIPSLEVLILGGEPLTRKTIQTWASHVRLINAYGTSECSVTNTVNADVNLDTDATNIGRAVGGACWIVDISDHNKLAPIGAIGELVIEGPTLARGYLNDESRTSAAFINHPAWAREENGIHRPRRIYKTGDLAQYNSDGSICYRGRKDTQVKIRGQRVELYEVEKHLMDHPDVECAMALVPNSGPCAKALTAVVQARSIMTNLNLKDIEIVSDARLKQMGFQWSELSTYLHERVPVYMIPTKWVALEKIPLHITKKLDRSKVAAWLSCLSDEQPNVGRVTNGDASPLGIDEAVAMELSHKIAELVSDDSIVGHNATISSIGVDSIRIVSLSAFIKKHFAVSIPMQTFIDSQINIRDISRLISEAKAGVEPRVCPQLDLMEEVSRLESQLICIQRQKFHLDNVFLTGANGFLGTQILRQLLRRPDVGKVTVHVRAESLDLARQRVITSAQAAGWPADAFSSKLEVWIGDLAHPRLGLTFQQWESLGSYDAIIHNGAAMQWNADYHALKASNVMSTMELLSVLSMCRYKHLSPKFIYVSGGRDFGDEVSDDEAAKMLTSVEGYSQTKFVSELLVKNFKRKSKAHGLDVCIVKPALIIGTAEEGVANENDFLWRMVAGAVNIGGFPSQQGGDDWLMVSSVDRVAAAVIQCLVESGEEEICGRIISIAEGVTLPDFWATVSDTLGSELEPMDYDEWMQRLQKDVDTRKESHPLWPVMHLLNKNNLASKRPRVDGVSKEGMDSVRAAIPRNVRYLVDRGFLQRPRVLPGLAKSI
ncbi:MAG: hypothetical protein Q9195_002528, partial [Heterodermia aff. obscurata]